MSLRSDFVVHKKKTVESFQLVRIDISNLNNNQESLRASLSAVELRLASLDSAMSEVKSSIDKISVEQAVSQAKAEKMAADLVLQADNNYSNSKKFGGVNKSLSDLSLKIGLLNKNVKSLSLRNTSLSKSLSAAKSAAKKSDSKARQQAAQLQKIVFEMKNSKEEARKLKSLLKRNMKTIKKADGEIDFRLNAQRKRIVQLNRKIEGAAPKKVPAKSPASKKVKRAKPKRQKRKIIKSVTKATAVKKSKSKKPSSTRTTKKEVMNLDKRVITSTRETISPKRRIVVERREEIKK